MSQMMRLSRSFHSLAIDISQIYYSTYVNFNIHTYLPIRMVYKPDSVIARNYFAVIYLGCTLPYNSSDPPA